MKRILITGATSGIGLALANRLSGRAELLLTGRRSEDEAGMVIPADSAYAAMDQSNPDVALASLHASLDFLGWDGLDLAILNAGTGATGDPAGETPSTIRTTLDANLVTPMLMAHALFPRLAARSGKLVLVGSVAHKGASRFASYAASKAGLHGLGRALASEWQGRVGVQVIHPGATATAMHERAGFDPGRAGRWFLTADSVAAMIEAIMASARPVSSAGHLRFLASPNLWWNR